VAIAVILLLVDEQPLLRLAVFPPLAAGLIASLAVVPAHVVDS
jgi:hypothetical protein